MGLITKIVFIALICLALFWAFNNVKIGTMTVCVSQDSNELDVTCVENFDCVNYLTSLYGTYPDTPMYQFILTQTTSCELGNCQLRNFTFDRTCLSGETPVVYKVTASELLSKE